MRRTGSGAAIVPVALMRHSTMPWQLDPCSPYTVSRSAASVANKCQITLRGIVAMSEITMGQVSNSTFTGVLSSSRVMSSSEPSAAAAYASVPERWNNCLKSVSLRW